MKKSASIQKYITISSLSILLSIFTVILGAPLLRVLRQTYGPLVFWCTGSFVIGAAWLLNAQPLAIFLGAVWMTLGAYSEFEVKGLGWWKSGVLSVFFGACFTGFTINEAFRANGINTYAEIRKLIVDFLSPIQQLNPTLKLDADILIQQSPSAIACMLILAIGLGLIFERRVFSWLKLPHDKIASQLKLLEYRLPEYFIWVAMTAFLLTMVSFGGKAIAILSVNIVNVAVVLYFFQGLAVLEVFLDSMKAGAFTRFLAHIILIGQLFLVVSIVGLIDYWVDFRVRIQRMKTLGTNR